MSKEQITCSILTLTIKCIMNQPQESINNDKAPTVFASFHGVHIHGLPRRVWSDKGGEDVLVTDFMIEERGPGRRSMITEPSTHNPKIQRLWRDVFYGVIGLYQELFSFMEENAILDPFNEADMDALHYTR